MGLQDIGLAGGQRQHVVEHGLAHRDATAALLEEPARERLVEELGFVGNHIVEDGDGRDATLAQLAGHHAQRGRQVAHPILHDHQVRLPRSNLAGGLAPVEGVGRVEHGFAVDGLGLVFRRDVLRLAREQEGRILPRKGKGLDGVFLRELFEEVGVELGDAAAEGIKGGKVCDSHRLTDWIV